MRRLLGFFAVLAVYLLYAFFCWRWLAYPEPRHTLGEACWPCGFTSDGRYAVTYKRWWRRLPSGGGGEEATGPVQLWDLHTGTVAASFLDEQRQVDFHAEVSLDGRCVAIQEGQWSTNEKLRVFDVRSGGEHAAFDVPADATQCPSFYRFSPDGELFAAYTGTPGDERVTVWSLVQKRAPLVLPGARRSFALRTDGKHLAVTVPERLQTDANKGEICLRELDRGEQRGKFQARMGRIWVHVTFSPDGGILCADCQENSGYLHTCAWDLTTQRELLWLELASLPRFLPDGKALILQRSDGHVLIDTESWQERAFVAAHGGQTIPVAARPSLRSQLVVHCRSVDGISNPVLEWLTGRDGSEETETVEVHHAETGKLIAAISHKIILLPS